MQRSPGDQPKPMTKHDFITVMGPLARNCQGEPFTAQRASDYFDILRHVESRYLAVAVFKYLRTEKTPWFPMPAVLLELVQAVEAQAIRDEIDNAPYCEDCGSTGLVTVVYEETGHETTGYCLACPRGRHAGKGQPVASGVFRVRKRRLPGPVATDQTARIPDFSVPPAHNKPAAQQKRELSAKEQT